MLVLVPVQAST